MKKMYNKIVDEQVQNFFHNIKKIRLSNNLTLDDMAQTLNIPLSQLTQLENDEMPDELTSAVLFAIHKKFDILPKDLFGKRL